MQYPQPTIESIIRALKKHNPEADISIVKKAHSFASKKHGNELFNKRPFIEHSLSTAQIVADLDLGEENTAIALLHNIFDNNKAEESEILEEFGEDILTVLKEYKKLKEIEKANFGKISDADLTNVLLSSVTDARTLFIKIAARMDSLRTINDFPKKEQIEKASSAFNIYVPICHKLGIYALKHELEDLAFKKLQPEEYNKIKGLAKDKKEEREKTINEFIEEISEKIKKSNIPASIYGRVKNFYGIYKKMKNAGKKFSELNDLLGIRIICNSVKECYEILGIIHSNYESSSQYFDDYISSPKPNGYKSIHTTVKWKNKIIEIQLRTWEMHRAAEDGLAAHWQYKQYEKSKYFDKDLSIAKQIVEWQRTSKESKNLTKFLKLGFGGKKVFVFTPKREVIVLPEKSTPIDFAFAVHSDIGKNCSKAKVNNKIVPLDYELQNGETIEIITSKKPQVKRQWLYFTQSEKAKTKIKRILGIKEKFKPQKKNRLAVQESQIRIAQCCNPVPGDDIVGVKTTKRKIIVHRKNCKNIGNISKTIDILWNQKESHLVKIKVSALDDPGLLAMILTKIAKNGAEITNTNTSISSKNTTSLIFTIKIKNLIQLEKITGDIENIPIISSVERI